MRIPIWLASAAMSAPMFTSTTEPRREGRNTSQSVYAREHSHGEIEDTGRTCHWRMLCTINFGPMGDGPCCFLAQPVCFWPAFFFILQARESGSRWVFLPLRSPAFVLAERGRGVGGERGAGADERGPVGAAGPARGEAHKQRRQGGKWRGVACWLRCGGKQAPYGAIIHNIAARRASVKRHTRAW
jgi:hypothetical protein